MTIQIRKYEITDAELLFAAVTESIEHVSKWLPWCTENYSMSDADLWVRQSVEAWDRGDEYRFMIEDGKTKKILGAVGISQIVKAHKVGNLGYWVRKSALGRGVAGIAGRKAIEYAFDHLDMQRIEIHVLPENAASNAVAVSLGGMFEGVFRNKIVMHGKSLAANCYSVVPSDYKR